VGWVPAAASLEASAASVKDERSQLKGNESAASVSEAALADASWIVSEIETVEDEEERLRLETQATIRKMSIKERIRQQRSLDALKQLEELRKRAVAAIDREVTPPPPPYRSWHLHHTVSDNSY
jgi:hypothetical protein